MSLADFRENLERECAMIVLSGYSLCPRYKIPQWACIALGTLTSVPRVPFDGVWYYRAQPMHGSTPSRTCPHVFGHVYWYELNDRERARLARSAAGHDRYRSLRDNTVVVNAAEVQRAQAEGYVRVALPESYGALAHVRYFWTGRTRRFHPKKEPYVHYTLLHAKTEAAP